MDNNLAAFFSLIKAGLWEKEVQISTQDPIDYNELFRLAEEQSVVGLLAAGFECIKDIKVPQEVALSVAGEVLQLEQRNQAMNDFIAQLSTKLIDEGIATLLVKGQGIAQCYSRPLWRSSGDIDLLLDDENYKKASEYLKQQASSVDSEDLYKKHLPLKIGIWDVELHGTLRGGLWKRLDHVIDKLHEETFSKSAVRIWRYRDTDIYLPDANIDVLFVFTHILQHFFGSGIGLRQICDWCRLLWAYQKEIDWNYIESKLYEMEAVTEWKAFAAIAVDCLGMPNSKMPLYDPSPLWSQKAERIIKFINETGNFGHNRDLSYQRNSHFIVRKFITLRMQTWDSIRHLFIFPRDSMRVWLNMFRTRIKVAFK